MSDIIRRAAKGFVPAGYLPAPQQARFISTAEEAAKRLPASIKAQSVQNQLQKFGAKPLELEYAQLGQFLQGKDRVSSQEVLQHLQQQGPLGQLRRVDQGDAKLAEDRDDRPDLAGLQFDEPPLVFNGPLQFDDEPPPFIDNENWAPPNHNLPAQQTKPAPKPIGNFYQADVRAPFGSDPRGSYPQTGYARYTVPGQSGDYTGYREVLIEDPRNRSPVPMLEEGRTSWAKDAHAASYWLRYNNLPDRVAIQNVQSDIGQRTGPRPPEPLSAWLDDGSQVSMPEYIEMLVNGLYDDMTPDERINEIKSAQHALDSHNEALMEYKTLMAGKVPGNHESPIVSDNNWKNLLLRHALLESVNQGGKPITLPTGQQMVDVEKFGMGGSGGTDDPAAKATRFNEDLAGRLLKAFREIHPKGATVSAPGAQQGQSYTLPLVRSIQRDNHGHVVRSEDRRVAGSQREMMAQVRQALESGRPKQSRGEPRWLLNRPATDGQYFSPETGIYAGLEPSAFADLEEMATSHVLPEARQLALDAMNAWQLAAERGTPLRTIFLEDGSVANDSGDPAPGWTITPHPETVRAALQKGVPIMSLAPLLLAPQEEQQ